MITKLAAGGVLMALLVTGCTDRKAEAKRAREETEARARAEAARKEMEAVPQTFKSRDYFKENEPEKKPDQPSGAPKPDT